MERVRTYYIARSTHAQLVPNVYHYAPGLGWKWLQRFCLWILERIGSHYYQQIADYGRVEVNFDDIVGAVLKLEQSQYYLTGDRARYIIMGYDKYRELMQSSPVNMIQFQFPEDFRARVNPPEYRGVFAGMKIVVVPWIDGLFLLPEIK